MPEKYNIGSRVICYGTLDPVKGKILSAEGDTLEVLLDTGNIVFPHYKTCRILRRKRTRLVFNNLFLELGHELDLQLPQIAYTRLKPFDCRAVNLTVEVI